MSFTPQTPTRPIRRSTMSSLAGIMTQRLRFTLCSPTHLNRFSATYMTSADILMGLHYLSILRARKQTRFVMRRKLVQSFQSTPGMHDRMSVSVRHPSHVVAIPDPAFPFFASAFVQYGFQQIL